MLINDLNLNKALFTQSVAVPAQHPPKTELRAAMPISSSLKQDLVQVSIGETQKNSATHPALKALGSGMGSLWAGITVPTYGLGVATLAGFACHSLGISSVTGRALTVGLGTLVGFYTGSKMASEVGKEFDEKDIFFKSTVVGSALVAGALSYSVSGLSLSNTSARLGVALAGAAFAAGAVMKGAEKPDKKIL